MGPDLIRAGLRAFRGIALAAGFVSTATASPDIADSTTAAGERETTRWKSFSWHPGPRARCGTFAITELTVLRRFESPTPEERYYVSLDAGAAHNITARLSIGGSAFAAGDNSDRAQYGLRARFRYWLGQNASVDVAPGLILLGQEEDNADLVTPAPILRLGVNPTASFGLTYQIFESRRRYPYGEIKERGSYVGAQLGSTAGLVGTGFLLLVTAVGAILFIGAMASD
jgi:hypothetical protein